MMQQSGGDEGGDELGGSGLVPSLNAAQIAALRARQNTLDGAIAICQEAVRFNFTQRNGSRGLEEENFSEVNWTIDWELRRAVTDGPHIQSISDLHTLLAAAINNARTRIERATVGWDGEPAVEGAMKRIKEVVTQERFDAWKAGKVGGPSPEGKGGKAEDLATSPEILRNA